MVSDGGVVQRITHRLWEALTPVPVKQLLASVAAQLAEPGWIPLTGGVGTEADPITRADATAASYKYWRLDPLYKRAVTLTRDYTFGRGITVHAVDRDVQAVIDAFWKDPDNALFATPIGQWELIERIILVGELFPVLFVARSTGRVKVSLVEAGEITQIIPDPDNARRRLYYERSWHKQAWNWKAKTFTGVNQRVDYYPDWRAADKTQQGVSIEAIQCECGERVTIETCPHCGRSLRALHAAAGNDLSGVDYATVGDTATGVYMTQVRINSHGQRGMPAFYSGIRWVKVYKGFLEDRATITLAAATVAFVQRIKGSLSQMARMVQTWGRTSLERYGGGGKGNERARGARVLVENEAAQLEQFNFDTRSAAAYMDGRIFRQQIAAATGLTEPDLTGDPSVGNLASMTAMNGPQLKGFESWQELFAGVYRELFDFVVKMAIQSGELQPTRIGKNGKPEPRDLTVEVDFPPIVVRDLPSFISAVAQLIQASATSGVDYITPRRLAAIILRTFGETDIETALAELTFEPVVALPREGGDPVAYELPDETTEAIREALVELRAEREAIRRTTA
ncbi:MAG: hypothetical protein DRI81_00660 [Chloroflexi bacterium]|nr:MAG: hypothetical protein DRI81_00660 [Chloroflexota bacterium]